MLAKLRKNKIFKWSLFTAAIFLILLLLTTIAFLFFEYEFRDKIYPGITIGNIKVGGLSAGQAASRLNKRVDFLSQGGIAFSYFNQETVFFPLVASVESDLAYQTVHFDVDKTVSQAMQFGKIKKIDKELPGKLAGIFKKHNLKMLVSFEDRQIEKFLIDNFSHFSTPAKNAELIYEKDLSSQKIIYSIRQEEYGQMLDYDKGREDLKNNLSNLDNAKITLLTSAHYPEILKENCLNIEAKANNLLRGLPLDLVYGQKKWTIKKDEVLPWLILKKSNNEVIVGLDLATTTNYLETVIAPKINIAPIDAKFEIIGGKVNEFQVARDGLILDAPASAALLEKTLLNTATSALELFVKAEKSKLTADTVNDFGISEIIGTGHSNFAGSPKNRRHNIAVGAAAVNGTLITPGEEFSLIKTLGKIDKEAGYLPELVIKDNKTIPEYGGGLCQIGTTAFRATFESGLPVTMRRNHSYRVSYYEPAGTDATIYDPWPDYRFVNDTKNHVLIQARIEGDDLYFDFWGKADGRIATHTYPTIYNIVKPGPKKIIETTDLKPGEEKCTEHAHNGADAYFDYKIIYTRANPPIDAREKIEITDADLIKETRFKSHYVPWREVCLVGKENSSADITASSTTQSGR